MMTDERPDQRERSPAEARQGADDNGDDQSSLGQQFREWIGGLLGGRRGADARDTIEDLIGDALEAEGSIGPDERLLLSNILKLRDLTVVDVMVPRADIQAVDADLPLAELTHQFIDKGHSRLPVYRETLDDVLGFVHIKDVLRVVISATPDLTITDILRPVQVIAPSMRVTDLLLEMRQKRAHMALVVDEFGGIDGLVTIEDLVEEIVGEINDEHDADPVPQALQRPDGIWVIDARYELEALERHIGKFLDEEQRDEFDTVGGLVASLAGRVPARGELLRHDSGIEFEVLDSDPRRVKRVRARLPVDWVVVPVDHD
jgi:CBS domain containing-hemolysin-like protein